MGTREIFINQVVIMKALLLLITDEDMKREINNQIVFTQALIRALV